MNDKKQIEEMAKDVFRSVAWKELEDGAVALDVDVMTSNLYNAGCRKQIDLTPCDVCRFNPPSSADGKPCLVCPAQAKGGA